MYEDLPFDQQLRICVLTSGRVLIGHLDPIEILGRGQRYVLTFCASLGYFDDIPDLGSLAHEGIPPGPNPKVSPCWQPPTEIGAGNLEQAIKCNPEYWQPVLENLETSCL